jgi:DNA end-binding protein Ku
MSDPRPFASATLSFGQVPIPVKLYPAVESKPKTETPFIHKECGTRVRQVFECPLEKAIIEREQLAKGYEFAKDQYVELPPSKAEETDGAPVIELQDFRLKTFNAGLYYADGRSYLGPDKGAERAYRMLVMALHELEAVAIGQYLFRGRTRLAMIVAIGERLVLQQLHYDDQVRDLEHVPVPEAEISPRELAAARKFIKRNLRNQFAVDGYVDEDRKRLDAEITNAVAQRQRAAGAELLDQLQESIGDRRAPEAGRRRRRAS